MRGKLRMGGGGESQTLMDAELSCNVFFSIFLFFTLKLAGIILGCGHFLLHTSSTLRRTNSCSLFSLVVKMSLSSDELQLQLLHKLISLALARLAVTSSFSSSFFFLLNSIRNLATKKKAMFHNSPHKQTWF